MLDITMPWITGLEVARRLRARGYEGGVGLLTVHDYPDYAREAFAAGGIGARRQDAGSCRTLQRYGTDRDRYLIYMSSKSQRGLGLSR